MTSNVGKKLSTRRTALVRAVGMIAAAGLMTSVLSGCGEPSYPTPTVYPVKGQVLLPDGKPLTSGVIVLVSQNGRRVPWQGGIGWSFFDQDWRR